MSVPAETEVAAPATTSLRGVRLGDRLSDRDNNFDLLRLLAAWAVLVSHSFGLLGEDEPLHQLGTSLGPVGVLLFFAISGLLIRRSWEYDPNPRDFWTKRALRLLPALAVVGVVTAFVIGPLVTRVSLSTYFSSWETWVYPLRITFLVPFGAQLPGVFDDRVYAGAVNGPLWSLPVEVFAYFCLFLLGITGLLARRRLLVAICLVSLAWAAVWVEVTTGPIGAIYVLAAFAVGATAYSFRDRIVLSTPVALVILPLCYLAGLAPSSVRVVVWTLASVYLCCWVAYGLRPIGRFLTRFGDASYGVYIWAWPVQQTVIQIFDGDVSPWAVILICTPVVWVLAQLSWHLVEAPALRHKPRPVRPVE